MTLLLTTQSYRKDVPTPFGLLLEMDTGDGRILRQLRINTPVKSALPGERLKPGLRGIYSYQGKLYVCTWNRVYVVDPDTFEVTGELSHQWMSDLHGIHVNQDGIWVTSSLPDALLLYDFEGTPRAAFWVPESCLYETPVAVDRDIDWRMHGKGFRGFKEFHANHVTLSGDTVYLTGRGRGDHSGRVVSFDRRVFIEKGTLQDSDLTIFADHLQGPHDGEWANGSFWVTETRTSGLCKLDDAGNVVLRVQVGTDDGGKSFMRVMLYLKALFRSGKRRFSITRWTRGLAISGADIFVGQSTWAGDDVARARVVQMDAASHEIRNTFYVDIPFYPETRIFQVYIAPAA